MYSLIHFLSKEGISYTVNVNYVVLETFLQIVFVTMCSVEKLRGKCEFGVCHNGVSDDFGLSTCEVASLEKWFPKFRRRGSLSSLGM